MQNTRWILLAWFGWVVALNGASAQDFPGRPVLVGENFQSRNLGTDLDFFRDVTGRLTLGDLRVLSLHGELAELPPAGLTLDYSQTRFWLAGQVENTTTKNLSLVLTLGDWGLSEARLHSVQDGQWTTAQTGLEIPVQGAVLPTRFPAFALNLPPGGRLGFYLEVRGPLTAVNLPVTLSQGSHFLLESQKTEGVFALAAGLLFLVVFLCLGMWLVRRNAASGLLNGYMLGVAGQFVVFSGYPWFLLGGAAQLWGFGVSPWLISLAAASYWLYSGFQTGLLGGGAGQKPAAFDQGRTWTWAAGAVIALSPLFLFWTPFYLQNLLAGAFVFVSTAVVLGLGVRQVLRGGALSGGFLVAGALLVLLGSLLVATRSLGILVNHAFGLAGFYLLAMIQVFLLSLGAWLEDRVAFRRTQDEKARLTHDLAEAEGKIRLMAREDGLTGLYNRPYIQELLQREFQRFKRYAHPFSVIQLDLDHFRQVNDTYGAELGDAVLKRVASLLMALLRSADVAARTGGEEFFLLLPETTGVQANLVAEKIRQALHSENFETPEGGRFRVTASLGLVQVRVHHQSPAEVLRDVSDALYKAKQTGRDRAILNLG